MLLPAKNVVSRVGYYWTTIVALILRGVRATNLVDYRVFDKKRNESAADDYDLRSVETSNTQPCSFAAITRADEVNWRRTCCFFGLPSPRVMSPEYAVSLEQLEIVFGTAIIIINIRVFIYAAVVNKRPRRMYCYINPSSTCFVAAWWRF